jgi:hypothetical protein
MSVYITTIKKSKKRGIWQIKTHQHEIFQLQGFHKILDENAKRLGHDIEDTNTKYLITYGDEKIQNYHLLLKFKKHFHPYYYFNVLINKISKDLSEISIPEIMFEKNTKIDEVFVRIEETEIEELIVAEKLE